MPCFSVFEKYFIKVIEDFFCAYIASSKHMGGWKHSRKLRKLSTASWVCITVLNSPSPPSCLDEAI